MSDEYVTAANRAIKVHPGMVDDLPPIANIMFADIISNAHRGAKGGYGGGMLAIMTFCIFTYTLPPTQRITFDQVEANLFDADDLRDMIVAGNRIIAVLFPLEGETQAESEDEPKADAPARKSKKKS